uniref:TSA: Wollemia nobilis Ref_Wollemi_Transcript_19275_1140 transcribed RNA sequence n=1 Tax=Wollemia nobilis TaxID=56998 RepID=A0A0C9S5H2_9CONI
MAVTCGTAFRIVLVVVVIAAVTTACFTLPINKMLKDFLVWIDKNLGPWGPLVLAVAYIPLTVLAVPPSILTLGGGYLFGLPIGFIADSIGSTIGCTAAFLVGKTIGRSFVESKLKDYPQFQAVAIAINRSGFKIVLLLRLVPLLPFNMLNYLLSVTPVGVVQYMLASWIGMMPITLALVYVGTTIKDLSDVTHGWSDISTAHWIMLIGSLVASAVLIFLVTQVAKRSLAKALEEHGKLDSVIVPLDSVVVSESGTDIEQPLLVKTEPLVSNGDK